MLPFILWVALRILSSAVAGMISSYVPATQSAANIPYFPPQAPIIQWFNRAFIAPWMHWDALWYQKIVSSGYTATDGTAQFHPLYPWLAVPLVRIGVSPATSLLIISSIAGIFLYYLFFKLARYDLDERDAIFSFILFALSPPAFIFFAPYPEALFLLLAVACFLFLRQKSWWLAGLVGGLASLTRQQGIFLFIPMAWELWEHSEYKFVNIKKYYKDWLAIILIPLGLLTWLLYRALYLNDFHVSFSNLQQFLYSTIISPSAEKVVPSQQFTFPWLILKNVVIKLLANPDTDIWVNIILGLAFVIILALSWKMMRISYRLYALTIFLASFSYYTGPAHPYMGLPRHLLLAFPIFIGLALLVKKAWSRLILIGVSGLFMVFCLVLYLIEAWVP